LEALHDIRRMGVKIGVISNCAPEEVAAWSTSALPACCDDAVFSCQVGCAKPGADIYRLACRRLGVVPNDAIFVGDGGSDELEGAAGVGMAAYQATWFLDQWPAWRRAGRAYERASLYPRLRTPADLRALVAAQHRSDGWGIALRSAGGASEAGPR
jgi:putative hydrolase of the HAD superfamily